MRKNLFTMVTFMFMASWSLLAQESDQYEYQDRDYDPEAKEKEVVVYIEGEKVFRTVRAIAQDECGRQGSLAKSYKATSETLLEIQCDDGNLIQTPRLNTLLRQEGRYSCAREHSGLYAVYFDFHSKEAIGRHIVRVECGSYDYVP